VLFADIHAEGWCSSCGVVEQMIEKYLTVLADAFGPGKLRRAIGNGMV
jgi:hypothetical protein